MKSRHNHYMRADNPERREWQNPEEILADIGLKAGDTFADIGCGGGFFTISAARIMNGSGKIYGIDADRYSIDELEKLAQKEGFGNIELIVGKAEDIILCNACADIIFLGVVLHDFEDALKVLQNAYKMAKPGGRLINLDWKAEKMERGPAPEKRLSREKAAGLVKAAGFYVEDIRDTGTRGYIITLSSQESPENKPDYTGFQGDYICQARWY